MEDSAGKTPNGPASQSFDPLADYRLAPDDVGKAPDPLAREDRPSDDPGALQREVQLARLRAKTVQSTARQSAAPRVDPTVWPPSPYEEPRPSIWDEMSKLTSTRYVSPIPLARIVTGLSVFIIALNILIVGLGAAHMHLREKVVYVGIELLDMIVLCFWVHQIYRNLIAFMVHGLNCSPAMAVASFFIPVVNVYMPVRRMQEAWQASDPYHRPDPLQPIAWRTSPMPPLIAVWWIANVTAAIVSRIYDSDFVVVAMLVHHVVQIWLVNALSSRQDLKVTNLQSWEAAGTWYDSGE